MIPKGTGVIFGEDPRNPRYPGALVHFHFCDHINNKLRFGTTEWKSNKTYKMLAMFNARPFQFIATVPDHIWIHISRQDSAHWQLYQCLRSYMFGFKAADRPSVQTTKEFHDLLSSNFSKVQGQTLFQFVYVTREMCEQALVAAYEALEPQLGAEVARPSDNGFTSILAWVEKSTFFRKTLDDAESQKWHIHPVNLNKSKKQYTIRYGEQYSLFNFFAGPDMEASFHYGDVLC